MMEILLKDIAVNKELKNDNTIKKRLEDVSGKD